ncbi:MAG: hypothetical protein M1818_003462 [Claussenomyces sp. TS43310]|nr:MAG: hypothetical protein M1818_003462 [Claussenomyces sp. TS43310]
MSSRWPSQTLLTERSPQASMYSITSIAVRLAALGHVNQSIELLSLSNAYYPVEPSYMYRPGLYFAFEAVDKWPAFVPSEHRTPEKLSEIEEEMSWGQRHEMFQLHGEPRPPQLKHDVGDLKRLLEWRESGERGMLAYTFEGNDEWFIKLSTQSVVLLSLDIALGIGGHEEEVARLQEIVKADLNTYMPCVGQSRRIWTLLKTGVLEPEGSKKNIDAEFSRVKKVLEQLLDAGVQRPFQDQSMEEIVHTIDKNTRRPEYREEDEDHGLQLDQKQPNAVRKDSILHHPASAQSIAALETRLDTALPEDYKEFLSITDGMNAVWNGFYKESFVASSSITKYVGDIFKGDTIPCELLPWEELPRDFEVGWPPIDFKYVIQLQDEEYGHVHGTWLVRPEMTRKAVEAFFERFESEGDRKSKKTVERVVTNYFGGIEQLRATDWALLRWHGQGGAFAWASFRDFLETLAVNSGQSLYLDW